MKLMDLEVIVRRDEESGGYWAEVVQLPGCFAAGHSREELEVSLSEAVTLYLQDGDLVVSATSEHVDSVQRFHLTKDHRLIRL